jgi:WD40-like Beta Propeller Repeat
MLRKLVVPLAVLATVGCQEEPQSAFSFYEERIDPILDVGCQRQTTGCHVDDGRGFALGNLDLTSFDSLMRRRDVLPAYGPYSVGLLLLKAGNPIDVNVRTIDPPDPADPTRHTVRITTDIRHAAGEGAISRGSRGYAALKQWIDGGFPRNGVPVSHPSHSRGDCLDTIPVREGIDLTQPLLDSASASKFMSQVQPVLKKRCAGSSCHGDPLADFTLTCGTSADQLRWNYEVSLRFLDDVPAASELLRRPLAKIAGGVFHEGGDVFPDVGDKDYKTILSWATETVERTPEVLQFGEASEGLRFFGNRVQPLLVRKGCMFLNCHSPAMFHDLKLRGGAGGAFSSLATRRNYEMARAMLATDSPDPGQSRLIAKNLCPSNVGGHGVQHRGGALLEDFGGCADADTRATADKCQGIDADAGDLNQIPAFCVFARWHAIERQAAIARGEFTDQPGPEGVVFVSRPDGVGGVQDFDEFHAGADLMFAPATIAANGDLTLGAPRSLLASCGLNGAVDIRGTAISWDAKKIAFGARASASAPLRIYEMNRDATGCGPKSGLAASASDENGILLHDFDPAYAPDGRLVFASTRGNIMGDSSVKGPTRTPASLTPNANLYVYDASASPEVRQLTFLLNQELSPSFMSDGRLIFTTEKRAQDFHQFAARRMNLDGGDYHPLIAQRGSIGFESATEVIELANRNFAFVGATLGASDGGGTIVVVNRSIGPDQDDRDPQDRAYVHSTSEPIASAMSGGTGVFRSPAALPSGRVLVACDPSASDLTSGTRHYGLCELDLATGAAPRMLWSEAGKSAVDVRAVWARAARPMFQSRADEVNGSTRVDASQSDVEIHFLDMPLLGTLLFANTRTGRPIDEAFQSVRVFESRPPPADATSFGALGSRVVRDDFGEFYQELRELGDAKLKADGSLRVRIPGGIPIVLEAGDKSGKALQFREGAPFTGTMRQREEMQFYPGERLKQSMGRRLFNGVCAGCHGSVSGRELDIAVDVDVLTSASQTLADDEFVNLR